jgi:hypothetical protein
MLTRKGLHLPGERLIMILINRTYETVTPEDGDDRGFLSQDVPYGFRELVDLLKCAESVSCSPCRGSTYEWATMGEEPNYGTGEITTEAVHYSRNNPPHCAKYWLWAMKAAGHLKD